MLEESLYDRLTTTLFRSLEDALAEVDPDLCEVTRTGDMVTLTFPSGIRAVLNTQRAVRQLWLAGRAEAWHFSWDEGGQAWLDDKGRGELKGILTALVRSQAGHDLLAAW
jgi:CyaY protein